jgi:hypothetical protein
MTALPALNLTCWSYAYAGLTPFAVRSVHDPPP